MRRSVTLALLCLAVPAFAAAQTPSDPVRLLSDIRDNLRIYMQDASTRSNDLSRKIGVLRKLADGAAAISGLSMSISLGKARGRLEEAQRTALAEPPLGEPIPSILEETSQLLNQSGMAAPDQVRAKLFVVVSRLEEHVIQQAAVVATEAGVLRDIERGLSQARSNLVDTAAQGVSTAIYVRRMALK